MSSYIKNSNLSKRSKHRRVNEELKSSISHHSKPQHSVVQFFSTSLDSVNIDNVARSSSFTSQSKSYDVSSTVIIYTDEIDEFEKLCDSSDDSSCDIDEDDLNESYDSLSHFQFYIGQLSVISPI